MLSYEEVPAAISAILVMRPSTTGEMAYGSATLLRMDFLNLVAAATTVALTVIPSHLFNTDISVNRFRNMMGSANNREIIAQNHTV